MPGKLICEVKRPYPKYRQRVRSFFGVMPAVPIHILWAAVYGLIQSPFSEYPEDIYII